MPSFQSTLAEPDIAEELAESQRQISIAEFFEKNKQMLGFDSGARALVTAIKEATDNSLDATEEAGFLPDIYIEIRESDDYYTIIVEDNGPGITKEQIPNIFGKLLYGSRFHVRDQSLLPDQQVLIKSGGEVNLVEIGDLCDAYIPNPEGESSVPVGDDIEAPCFDRRTGDIAWQDVTNVIRHRTENDTYRIETSRGRAIEVTGNHSLFALDGHGRIEEVDAAELTTGDHVIAPESLPVPEVITEINLLSYVPREAIADRDWYIYGLDRSLIKEIEERGDVVRKRASPGGRRRYYYRIDGVDILRDSLRTNYLQEGYLPAEVVKELGWEDRVADGVVRTYQVGGEATEIPVTVSLTEELMRFLGLFVAEGHSDTRQVGFTLGSHETALIADVERTADNVLGVSTTTVPRDRNSTRVKAFGSPLAVFLRHVCGSGSNNKRVPEFVFRTLPALQQAFLDALYDGDGSDAYAANQLSFSTTSERLAREVSYLWSMRGVVASWGERTNENSLGGDDSTLYRVNIHAEDLGKSEVYEIDTDQTAQYRRIPASIVDDIAVDDPPTKSVPATRAGVFLAAGFGSSPTFAERFVRRAEYALNGGRPPQDYYRRTLEEHGMITSDGEPTEALHDLWKRSERLSAFGDSDLCLLQVKDVSEISSPRYVYDLSVPGTGADENFVAGNYGALCVKNSRGQQGIGISAAVLYSQLTSGIPAKITSRTPSGTEAQYFELIIDTESNEPEIQTQDTVSWERPHGTRIELRMEANMRARSQLHDYITHTAIVNPHARIELVEPDTHLKFDRVTDELPDETESIRPHPHGVELGTVMKMLTDTDSYSLSGFLQEEFTRVGNKTATEILDAFRDRHFGREMAWQPPRMHDDVDIEAAVTDAVANKSAEATDAFASGLVERIDDAGSVAHHELVGLVDEVAGEIEDAFDTTFGETVRENAIDAAWEVITTDRVASLYELIDDATSDRKDDEVVRGLADRIANKFESSPRNDRVTENVIREYVDRSADMLVERDDATFGETARENVTAALWDAMLTVPDDVPSVREMVGDRDATADFLDAMRSVEVMAPPTDCLAPIRADLIEEGLRKEVDADFYTATTRDAGVHGGDPFVVEAGIAYGGDIEAEGQIDLLRFANRVPLVYQRGACAITDVIKGIDWRNYGLDQSGGSGMPTGPAVVMIHVASTNVPFTSESKDAVANIPAIEKEIELAVREAARDLKSHLNRRRSLQKRRRKQTVIADILPKMAEKVAAVTDRDPPNIDVALARIMNNVLVSRRIENGTVELVVENHTDAGIDLDVTEILSAEPEDLSSGTAVDMDDEWFIKWAPAIDAGETATLSYRVDGDATFDVNVDGVESEKLTVDQ